MDIFIIEEGQKLEQVKGRYVQGRVQEEIKFGVFGFFLWSYDSIIFFQIYYVMKCRVFLIKEVYLSFEIRVFIEFLLYNYD